MMRWGSYWGITLIFGSGFLFVNIASEQVSAFELTAVRQIIASVLLTAALYLAGGRLPGDPKAIRQLTILGIINYTIPFVLLTLAQQFGVGSGLSGVIITLNPLFTAIIANYALSDDSLTATRLVGALAGLAGTVILASGNITAESFDGRGLLGQLMLVGAALSFATSNVYTHHILADRRMTLLIVAAGTSIASAVTSSLLVLFDVTIAGNTLSNPADFDSDTVIAILVLALIHSVVPSVVMRYVIRELGAAVAATTQYIVPVIALGLGAIFLDEIIDLRIILGTVVILVGVALANFGQRLFTRLRQQTSFPNQ
jgi:drug/metabolite transporter (DMT)-like permease